MLLKPLLSAAVETPSTSLSHPFFSLTSFPLSGRPLFEMLSPDTCPLTIHSLGFLPFLNASCIATLNYWAANGYNCKTSMCLYFLKKWNYRLTYCVEINPAQQKTRYDCRKWVFSEKLLLKWPRWKRSTEMVNSVKEKINLHWVGRYRCHFE